MKKIFILIILFTFASCGENGIKIKILDDQNKSYQKDHFYMSNNEKLIEKYGHYKKVNLYETFPNLDDMAIENESFLAIKDALEVEAQDLPSNYAVIKKTPECLALVGYCEAYIIKRLKVRANWKLYYFFPL